MRPTKLLFSAAIFATVLLVGVAAAAPRNLDAAADTTAMQLVDNARACLKSNDLAQARAILAQLKDKAIYDTLSPATKIRVDDLARDIKAADSARQ